MTATTEFPLLAASDGSIQKNTIRRIGTIQFLHSIMDICISYALSRAA
jgi:hypothetical protein